MSSTKDALTPTSPTVVSEPADTRDMLPARVLLPRIGPRAYRRYALRGYGTATP